MKEYLSGKGSYRLIAEANGISVRILRIWVKKYGEQGETAFVERAGNASYSKEFKTSCVLAVLCGEGNIDDIVVKYNISSCSVLRRWIKQYNDHIELKDYDPKREVYMAGAEKKTSLSERKEIVGIVCRMVRTTRMLRTLTFPTSSNYYDWVRKYIANGEDGLIDRRDIIIKPTTKSTKQNASDERTSA